MTFTIHLNLLPCYRPLWLWTSPLSALTFSLDIKLWHFYQPSSFLAPVTLNKSHIQVHHNSDFVTAVSSVCLPYPPFAWISLTNGSHHFQLRPSWIRRTSLLCQFPLNCFFFSLLQSEGDRLCWKVYGVSMFSNKCVFILKLLCSQYYVRRDISNPYLKKALIW